MTVPWPATIRTRRLELRPYRASDYEAWMTAFAARRAPRYPHDGGPHDRRETPRSWFRALCSKHRRRWRRDEVYVFGVFDRRTGDHLGGVDLGIVELTAGKHQLRFQSVGKNPQSVGYMIGVDCYTLQPAE